MDDVLIVGVDGWDQTIAALRALGPDARLELRKRTETIAEKLAVKVKAAGQSDTPQSARAAHTVTVVEVVTPAVVAGPHPLLFGSEFGMTHRTGWYAKTRYGRSRGRQFRRHQRRGSYWFFRTVEASAPDTVKQFQDAADAVARRFDERAAP